MLQRPHKIALALFTTLLISGCYGELDIDINADSQTPGTTVPGQSTQPGQTQQPGQTTPTNPGTTTPQDPTMPTAPPPILSFATVGSRCLPGASGQWLVLSDVASDCAADARRLDSNFNAMQLPGAVALPLDGNPQIQQVVNYCPIGGTCESITMNVSLTGNSGTWSATIGGQPRSGQFTATSCDYDTAVEPLPGDSPAAGLSITDVAVYQAVKIPVVDDGQMVADLNAPIVAERPGVVRVFVRTEADWQQREVLVRLTLGDVVKEVPFSPMNSSTENIGDSTANFELVAGELQADAEFSVEILEAQSCASVPGAVATPRVPATGTQALEVDALADNMRIVLVPIQYDGDGSGRLPNLDNATVERWRQEAYKNYPVPDVEMTVREPVAYGSGIAPNGSGFGAALNFCLNLRANDNPDNEVYYYCVFQPAETKQQFCGGGCVAGVAPVPGANDVDARAGIGISFAGDGEGVFVHEIGHTLGRPHSPCGGVSGADPNYPYAQGRIGSWGFDIMSGALFNPEQRSDFMGYCDPTWVSDYTYDLIFDRLQAVIGTQQVMFTTPPTTWRTAVIEDGRVSWGNDRVLTRLPTGRPTLADLRDRSGTHVMNPQVYVTPVADIDAVLVTIEDVGTSGQRIEIPGYGELVVP